MAARMLPSIVDTSRSQAEARRAGGGYAPGVSSARPADRLSAAIDSIALNQRGYTPVGVTARHDGPDRTWQSNNPLDVLLGGDSFTVSDRPISPEPVFARPAHAAPEYEAPFTLPDRPPPTALDLSLPVPPGPPPQYGPPEMYGPPSPPKRASYYTIDIAKPQVWRTNSDLAGRTLVDALAQHDPPYSQIASAVRRGVRQLVAQPLSPATATIAHSDGDYTVRVDSPFEAAYLQYARQAVDNWRKVDDSTYLHPTNQSILFDTKTGRFRVAHIADSVFGLDVDPEYGTQYGDSWRTDRVRDMGREITDMLSNPKRTNFFNKNFKRLAGTLRQYSADTGGQYDAGEQRAYFERMMAEALRLLTLGVSEREFGMRFDTPAWRKKLQQVGIQ